MFYRKSSASKDGIEGFIAPWELSVSGALTPMAFTLGMGESWTRGGAETAQSDGKMELQSHRELDHP